MNDHASSEHDRFTISRRDLLRTAILAGAAIPILNACTSDSSTAVATVSASADVTKGGTLRAAISGGSSSDTLDCQSAITTIDFARILQLNEPLIGFGSDAKLHRTRDLVDRTAAERVVRMGAE